MRIVPFPRFQDARSLRWPPDLGDPRKSEFMESAVEVDLRRCELVGPSAALWCVVYALLARQIGVECRVLVPESFLVCAYLNSLGMFQILRESGVDIDDRDIPVRHSPKIVLPLARFDNESEAEGLANRVIEALTQSGLGVANLYPLVSETIAELAVNAVEHSVSGIGAFGLVQFHDEGAGQKFECVVADGGIGVRQSLQRNPNLRPRVPYDWIAVELAVREQYSGTGDATRGIGLFGIAEDMRTAGRTLMIHSGIGSLVINDDMQSSSRKTRLFPGTLAHVSIPT